MTLISRIYFVIFRANIKKIYNYRANIEGNENKTHSINQKEAGKKKRKKEKHVRHRIKKVRWKA